VLDPRFVWMTEKGKGERPGSSPRRVNKVRPRVNNHGGIVAVNDSLYLSGAEYLQSIEELCSDGYLSLEEIIPVPEDVTGTPETIKGTPPVSPAPFNHPTKIVILNVKRGQG